MTLPTPLASIKSLCARYGLLPQKSLGQHFLIDSRVLAHMVEKADLSPSDTVLEIGPGLGILTVALAQKVKSVIAVELDRNILPPLKEVVAAFHNVTIVHGDILKLPTTDYLVPRAPYKLVANIPYDITGAILRKFLTQHPLPTQLTLMMQYEVATRIMARAGNMSILALAVRYAGVPTMVQKVPPQAFWPMPKVSSAILTITPHTIPRSVPEHILFAIIKKGFSQKRKQLSTTLSEKGRLSKQDVEGLLQGISLNPRARPQDLSLEDWELLAKAGVDAVRPDMVR